MASLAAGIYFYRHRYVRSDEDLLVILPAGDVTTFFANVGALRDSGMLKLLTGTRVAQEREYEKFVREINFDYARDLDRIAGAVDGNQLYFLLRGRFDWEKLRTLIRQATVARAMKHTCRVPTSTPGRWASFHLIQPDVLALAVERRYRSGESAATLPAERRSDAMPTEPVWVRSFRTAASKSRRTASAAANFCHFRLQSASPVVLSAGASNEQSGTAFRIALDAGLPE